MSYVGLYDPDTLSTPVDQDWKYETDLCLAFQAFGKDAVLAFCREAVVAGDEYKVERDRYGRTLSQNSIVKVTMHNQPITVFYGEN